MGASGFGFGGSADVASTRLPPTAGQGRAVWRPPVQQATLSPVHQRVPDLRLADGLGHPPRQPEAHGGRSQTVPVTMLELLVAQLPHRNDGCNS